MDQDRTPFRHPATRQLLDYMLRKFGSRPEFLWATSPNNAILRHAVTGKWYAAVLIIAREKLGLDGGGSVEILNVKCDPMLAEALIDGKTVLPGYHMHKKRWITIIMTDQLDMSQTENLIDASHSSTG